MGYAMFMQMINKFISKPCWQLAIMLDQLTARFSYRVVEKFTLHRAPAPSRWLIGQSSRAEWTVSEAAIVTPVYAEFMQSVRKATPRWNVSRVP